MGGVIFGIGAVFVLATIFVLARSIAVTRSSPSYADQARYWKAEAGVLEKRIAKLDHAKRSAENEQAQRIAQLEDENERLTAEDRARREVQSLGGGAYRRSA